MNRLCLAVVIIMSALLTVSTAYSQRAKPSHGAPGCQRTLEMCTDDLDTCDTELAACEAAGGQISPGDGYSSPGPFGLPGHVPALSYTDNFDGTFTDDNTGCMWEKKLKSDGTEGGNCTDTQSNRSVHCVNNTYPWTAGTTASDGTLFTEYLDTLNNKCDGDETTLYATDANCTGIGNGLCGIRGLDNTECKASPEHS